MSGRVLVYGIAGPDVVFIDRDLAEELARLRAGFGTWGDARAALPGPRWQEIIDRLEGAEIDVPAPEQPFDLDLIPGYVDGDWPEWPAQQMFEWMPPELIARFGRSTASVLNGDFLEIDPLQGPALAASLEETGWTCIRDDALVSAASGFPLQTPTPATIRPDRNARESSTPGHRARREQLRRTEK